jgi:RimJ/RimL family protein N-acetyltransferase
LAVLKVRVVPTRDRQVERPAEREGVLMQRLSAVQTTVAVRPVESTPASVSSDWKQGLPVLRGRHVHLREMRVSDAPSLLAMLTVPEVSRFISPPPATVAGFERFIQWTQRERAAGRYICFAVVPDGLDSAVGLFQVRALEPAFTTAEWGFALGAPFWGTGVFMDGARLTVEFALETVGVHRLEARAVLANGRGNGALAKIGAVKEAVLRQSFLRNGQYVDQALWSIVREDWHQAKAVWGSIIH